MVSTTRRMIAAASTSMKPFSCRRFRSAAISAPLIASFSRRALSIRRSSSRSMPSAAKVSATPSGSGPDINGRIACSRSAVSSRYPSRVISYTVRSGRLPTFSVRSASTSPSRSIARSSRYSAPTLTPPHSLTLVSSASRRIWCPCCGPYLASVPSAISRVRFMRLVSRDYSHAVKSIIPNGPVVPLSDHISEQQPHPCGPLNDRAGFAPDSGDESRTIFQRGLLCLGQVVDGGAAHGLRGEVGRHPGRDRRRAGAAAEAAGTAPDVVVDLALGDHRLELGQCRRRVGAVEAADRHHGVAAGRQLDRRGLLGALGRGDPLVLRGVLLEQLDQGAAHLRAAGQPAAEPAAGTAGTAEPAGAATRERARPGPGAGRPRAGAAAEPAEPAEPAGPRAVASSGARARARARAVASSGAR